VLASSPNAPISKLILEGFSPLLPEADRIKTAFASSTAHADNGRGRRLFRRQPAHQAR
jgi:hypothetical protein